MQQLIEKAWERRELLDENPVKEAVREAIDMLDRGLIRVAEPADNGWKVNEWVKKAVLLYFPLCGMQTLAESEWCLRQWLVTAAIWLQEV